MGRVRASNRLIGGAPHTRAAPDATRRMQDRVLGAIDADTYRRSFGAIAFQTSRSHQHRVRARGEGASSPETDARRQVEVTSGDKRQEGPPSRGSDERPSAPKGVRYEGRQADRDLVDKRG
jgi:hypothetical protein